MIEDLATLGIRADTRSLKNVRSELIGIGHAGDQTEKKLNSAVNSIDNSMRGLHKTIGFVGMGLAAITSNAVFREITEYDSKWKQTNNTLRQVVDSEKQLQVVRSQLLSVSKATNSELSTTASLYSGLHRSTRELGVSSEKVVEITKTINNLFLAGGKSAEDAAGAIRQLVQGLESGALRGDEFNSVAEGAPRIMDAMAASLKMNRAELREFAADGKITSEIIVKALDSYSEKAQQMADMTERTYGQKMENATTNVTKFVGESTVLNTIVGSSGDLLVILSENLDMVANSGAAVALVFGGRVVSSITASVAAKVADARATEAQARATVTSTTAEIAYLKTVQGSLVAQLGANAGTSQAASLRAQLAANTAALTGAVNANNAATKALSITTQTTSAVMTGFKGALALIGGPVGAAFLAMGAVYAFREELGLVPYNADRATQAIDKVTASLNNLTVAGAKKDRLEIVDELSDAEKALEKTAIEIEHFNRELNGEFGIKSLPALALIQEKLIILEDRFEKNTKAVTGLKGTLTELDRVIDGSAIKFREAGEDVETLMGRTDLFGFSVKTASESVKGLETSTKELADTVGDEVIKELDALFARVNAITDSIYPQQAEVRKLKEEWEDMAAVLQYKGGKLPKLMDDWINKNVMISNTTRKVGESIKGVKQEVDPFAAAVSRGLERVDDSFANTLKTFLKNGKLSFDELKDLALDTLAEIIYAYARNKILASVGLGGTGGTSSILGGGSGGSMDFGSMLSTAKSIWNGVGTLFGASALTTVGATASSTLAAGTITGATASGIGAGGATASGALAAGTITGATASGAATWGTTMAAGFKSALAYWPLAIVAGMYMSGKAYDAGVRPDASKMWDSAGGAIGQKAFMAPATFMSGVFEVLDKTLKPLVGGKIAAIITGSTFHQMLWTGISKALFGGEYETKDYGLTLGASGSDVDGQYFNYQKKDGGLFGKNKKKTLYSDLDSGLSGELSATYAGTVSRVTDYFKDIGITISQAAIDGFSMAKENISTKGKTEEEIQALVEAWFLKASEAMVASFGTSAGIDGLNMESLVRMAESLKIVNTTFDRLNLSLFDTSLIGAKASEQLIAVFGGIDNMTTVLGNYYTLFYSEEEKLQQATDELTTALQSLGFSMPESKQGFRDMVESIDRTTEEGMRLFAAMTALAPSVANVVDETEKLSGSVTSLAAALKSMSESGASILNKANSASMTTVDSALQTVISTVEAERDRISNEHEKKIADLKAMLDSPDAQLQGMRQNIDSTMSALQSSVASQKSSIQQIADARIAALNKEKDKITDSHEQSMKKLSDSLIPVNERIKSLQSVVSIVKSAFDSMNPQDSEYDKYARARASGVVKSALNGGSVSNELLQDSLKTLGQDSRENFSNRVDYLRDFLGTKNTVEDLLDKNESQLSIEERTLESINKQIELAGVEHAETIAKLEKQIETLQQTARDRMAGLDSQLELAQAQVDAVDSLGTNVVTLTSVTQAIATYSQQKELSDGQKAQIQEQINIAEEAYSAEMERLNQIIAEAKDQVDYLKGIENGVVSMASAIAALSAAITGANDMKALTSYAQGDQESLAVIAAYNNAAGEVPSLRALTYWLSKLSSGEIALNNLETEISKDPTPGFANGGDHQGGLRGVGEKGMELEFTGPSRIVNHSETRKMLDHSDIVVELQAYRQEFNDFKNNHESLMIQVLDNVDDIDNRGQKWDDEGLPDVRVS